MNYYEHHLGDWIRDTAHLSMIEEGAYRRLVDAYYVRQAPLPLESREVYRLVRASGKQDREAVDTVLREFFQRTDEGWRHRRCDREIERYQDKQAKAKRSADARWSAQRTQCGGNANASPRPMRTHDGEDANAQRTQCGGNALQSPDTSLQTPDPKARETRARELRSVDVLTPEPAWFVEFRQIYPRRAGDPRWDEAREVAALRIREGCTPEQMLSGARRYAAFVAAKGDTGTQFVRSAAKFLGADKPFLLSWDPPPSKADQRLAANVSAAEEFMRRTDAQQ